MATKRTPQPRRNTAANRVRDAVLSSSIKAQRVEAALRMKMLGHVETLAQRWAARVDALGRIPPGPRRYRASTSTIAQMRRDLDAVMNRASAEFIDDLREATIALAVQKQDALNRAVGADLFDLDLSDNELRNLAEEMLIVGQTVDEAWRRAVQGLADDMARQIRIFAMTAEGQDVLRQRIFGRQSGRHAVEVDGERMVVPARDGGVLGTAENRLRMLSRTAALGADAVITSEIADQNKDLVIGHQAVATLDSRTSKLCLSRHGAMWDLDGNPMPSSRVKIPFPGPPPWHPNCRTVLVPVLRSAEDAAKQAKGRRKAAIERTEALDGEAPDVVNADQFLDSIGEDAANELIGEGRASLWRAGKITLAQLVDQSGRALRVDELRRRSRRK